MKPSRFNEEQIIGILREQESGITVADLCRKHRLARRRFSNGKHDLASREAKLRRYAWM